MSNTQQQDCQDAAPALEELARRYLDLWQDQWSALAADPAMADMVARSFAMMGPAAAGFAGFANMLANANLFAATGHQGAGHQGATHQGTTGYGHNPSTVPWPSAAPWATAFTAAPANSSDNMAELRDRLSSMEQRLADLASHLGHTSPKNSD